MCIINLIHGVKTTNWPKVTQLVSEYGYGHFHYSSVILLYIGLTFDC